MKKFFNLLIFNLIALISFAQTDSIPLPKPVTTAEKIASSRAELLQSFLLDDPAGAGLWIDSLTRLENEVYAGLIWDERWMLYFWLESYGTLLEELSRFDENQRALQAWKIQPPKDSLFEWVDITLHEKRFELFSSIRSAFLNEEEKAISTLLIEYLLRLNHEEEEWAERLQSFENHYPKSRYLAFVRSIKPVILKPTNKGFGLSGGLLVGTWMGNIERSLSTPYAFNMDAYFWTDRWNFIFEGSLGGPTLSRDLILDGEIWPKSDPVSFITLALNLGYDIVNSPKIRIFPSIGGGVGFLRPPTPGEDEEPLPDYYENFNLHQFHLTAALTADVKLFSKKYRDWGMTKGSYQGVRLKFGWNGLQFGRESSYLEGQMLYFTVNYNLFSIWAKQQ